MKAAGTPASSALAPILGHLRAEPSRTWSLIITLYGDAVVPRGGTLWLGTLLEIFAAMEIGGNVVRTAMSRLAADGWLERKRLGRNSYYRLADKGRATFAAAAIRIYGPPPPAWDGTFHIAVVGPAERDAMRTALEAAGYAQLSPGVLLAAAPQQRGETTLPADMIPLRATTDPEHAQRLARQVWPAERLEEGYRSFLAAFRPLADVLARRKALSGLEALVVRLLMVHEYRRLVLRDPRLPDALLPPDWPGRAARALCGTLYPALLPPSERWLDENALDEHGRLPSPESSLFERFRP